MHETKSKTTLPKRSPETKTEQPFKELRKKGYLQKAKITVLKEINLERKKKMGYFRREIGQNSILLER